MATGAAHRLFVSGFRVGILELQSPLAVRRAASFAEAVYDGRTTVEGVVAVRTENAEAFRSLLSSCAGVPVAIDPTGEILSDVRPDVVLDARMAKTNLGTKKSDAPCVIALGPGFNASVDVHAVVETERGHDLGRVIWRGRSRPDSKMPYPIAGVSAERVLRAPAAGVFQSERSIGTLVSKGDVVASVSGAPVIAAVSGLLRGLMRSGAPVSEGVKVGDIDPRGEGVDTTKISDKARAIGGGVLEAVLAHFAGGRT